MTQKVKDSEVLIIGNGIAGLSAAEAARNYNGSISITMLSDESCLTYYRTRLCDLFISGFESQRLYVHPLEWYKDRRLDILLDRKVTGIVMSDRYIVVDGSDRIYFDKLIITGGSRCFIPDIKGINRKGVFTLRNIEDAKNISKSIENIEDVVVIGGGLLGLEAAYMLNRRNKRVSIVESFPRLLPNQLDEKGSEIFESKVRSLGINVLTGTSVKSIIGDDFANEAVLGDGKSLKTDLILFSVGIRPNIEIVKDTGINISRGIITDNFMKTNIENVYAAGDIAEQESKIAGLWTVALSQGKIAGANAAGENIEYVPDTNPYLMNSMDTKVYSIGDIGKSKEAHYEAIEYVDDEKYIYNKTFFKDNAACGGIMIGDISNMSKISRAVKEKMDKNKLRHILNDSPFSWR